MKKAFIDFMLDSQVLMFGDFVTKSGRNTPYFINTGNYTTGYQLKSLGDFYAQVIMKHFGERVTNLFGPAYKGITLGTAASIALKSRFDKEITVSFNRKEVKDHGEGGWLLGHQYGSGTPDKVVIIEDVITSGASVRECMPKILSLPNVEVIGLVISVDRKEKGKGELSAIQEVKRDYGINTVSLVDFNDLLEYLASSETRHGWPADIKEKMVAYRKEYGVA